MAQNNKRVALVTGVAGGIGYAVLETLLKNGISVVGMDILDQMPKTPEGEFVYIKGDLSKASDRQNFIDTAIASFGKINILVNVAGVAPRVRADIL